MNLNKAEQLTFMFLITTVTLGCIYEIGQLVEPVNLPFINILPTTLVVYFMTLGCANYLLSDDKVNIIAFPVIVTAILCGNNLVNHSGIIFGAPYLFIQNQIVNFVIAYGSTILVIYCLVLYNPEYRHRE